MPTFTPFLPRHQFLPRQAFYPNFTPFAILCALRLPCFYPRGKTAHFLLVNHWTTSDHHWSAGPVGGLYSWRGDAKDQFVRCVCSRMWEQAERCCKKARAQAAPITKKERRLNMQDDRWGWLRSVGCHPSCLWHPTS